MSPFRMHLSAALAWQSRAVVYRNLRVYLRNWQTAFLPPALEPLVLFLAYGIGVGDLVGDISHNGGAVSYRAWVAPGLLAYAIFTTAFFEALYGSYIRMAYQKTWDGLLTTQLELPHIVWGEVLWCALRGAMNGLVVALVLAGLMLAGQVELSLAGILAGPVVGALCGWAFATVGVIFTALVPSIDHMNYPVFLVGFPLAMTSNTTFPVRGFPLIESAMVLNPVAHLATLLRAMALGGPWLPALGGLVAGTLALLLVAMPLAQGFVHRRVLGE